MEETILMGTNREKAKQLYELLKERQLSVEELEKMVPMQVEFFKELSDVLKKQIDQEKGKHPKKYTLHALGFDCSFALAKTIKP